MSGNRFARMAPTYAPMPMNAPWLSDRYPVKPVMMFSPLAPMASTSDRITMFCADMLGDNGNSRMTTAATRSTPRVARCRSCGSSSRAWCRIGSSGTHATASSLSRVPRRPCGRVISTTMMTRKGTATGHAAPDVGGGGHLSDADHQRARGRRPAGCRGHRGRRSPAVGRSTGSACRAGTGRSWTASRRRRRGWPRRWRR